MNAIAAEAGSVWLAVWPVLLDWNNPPPHAFGVARFDLASQCITERFLGSNIVNDIAIDAANRKWFCTQGGVSVFDGSNWVTYTMTDGLASNTVNAMAIDAQDAKWFATEPSATGPITNPTYAGGGVSRLNCAPPRTPTPTPTPTATDTVPAPTATATATPTGTPTKTPTVTPTLPCPGIQGVVFSDLDCDGIRDPGEAGLAGAEITLKDNALNTLATYVTGSDGIYFFYNLVPGDYSVVVRCPAGYDESCTSDVWGIRLIGCHIVTVEFGCRVRPTPTPTVCQHTIQGYVWNDMNCNGVPEDYEPRLAGVVVCLQHQDGRLVGCQTTGSDGSFQFSVLEPDIYLLTITCPPCYPVSCTPDNWVVPMFSCSTPQVFGFGCCVNQPRSFYVPMIMKNY